VALMASPWFRFSILLANDAALAVALPPSDALQASAYPDTGRSYKFPSDVVLLGADDAHLQTRRTFFTARLSSSASWERVSRKLSAFSSQLARSLLVSEYRTLRPALRCLTSFA
jgi:hypothetical protein